VEREEDIAKQHTSLGGAIQTEIINLSSKAGNNSLEEVVASVIADEKFLGWSTSEHF
jgi:hypothetical protein